MTAFVGFDLDGVVAGDTWLAGFDGVGRRLLGRHWWGLRGIGCPVLLRPQGEFVIITAREKRWEKLTARWLARNRIRPAALFLYEGCVFTESAFAEYKARLINLLGLRVFVEDNWSIAERLRRLTNARIVSPEEWSCGTGSGSGGSGSLRLLRSCS